MATPNPLQKRPLDISFAKGLDLKTDPYRVAPGNFLALNNSVFDKGGQLQKRNGFAPLQSLPTTSNPSQAYAYLTTFNGNLTTVGTSLEAFSQGNSQWINKGNLQPISLNVLPAVRASTYQSQADSVTAANGLTCIAYTNQNPSGGTVTPAYYYVIIDSATGQNVVPPTALVGANSTYGTPRVFLLGNYFIIAYTVHPSSYNVNYIAISTINPTLVTSPAALITNYSEYTTVNWDGIVVNNQLYFAWGTSAPSVKINYLTLTEAAAGQAASSGTIVTFAGATSDRFSMCIDESSSLIYVTYYAISTNAAYTLAVTSSLVTALAPTEVISSGNYNQFATVAQNGICTIYGEVANAYGYDGSIPTDYINTQTITSSGSVGTVSTLVRSIGLASKAFLYNGVPYFLAIYNSVFQPTYFLINGKTGQVIARLAYSNGPDSYYLVGLPSVTLSGTTVQIPYLYKDLIQAVNQNQGVSLADAAGVYAQLGINLVTFNFSPDNIVTSEIGQNLNITGGFVTMYDGITPTEQNFFLYPDNVEVDTTMTTGNMTAQQYYYQVVYQWQDNQGNLFQSAPSLPAGINLSGSATVINVPTLRLTYKINNPVTIAIFRWSTAQQNYYQVTSITAPVLNSTTVDYISYTDTLSDSQIVGNALIYTTGGVLEDIAPPASDVMTLFNNRLWVLDSEDRNLLWYSKQVIEDTPVEMSDLLTLYVAPSTASEGSTGPITAMAPMDDKLIIFKQNALGYINGIGPDNTGANNGYSDFILINTVVGCTNQNSIVFMPQGLMFQTNKGIWLLGRDLSTNYIGAPVETLTQNAKVESAVNVPATNQVRFTLDSGITLMYDYYYGQWGTFTNVPATSSTIFNNLHTYINDLGQVFQESPGVYLDNTSPVLMSFTTGWINLAGLQGFERFYAMYLLGTYITPFTLNVQMAYNYNPSIQQATIVKPSPPSAAWGGEALWGSGGVWGGPSSVFPARIFPTIQKCQSFQISIAENYDPSYGIPAGAGLTLSGLQLLVGIKKGSRDSSAQRSFG